MKYACKAFKFQQQVDAPEASFENFFTFLESKGVAPWPLKEASRNALFRGMIHEENRKRYFCGVLIVDSMKKRGFSQEQHVFKEKELNANREVSLFVLELGTCKGLFGSYRGATTISTFLRQLWNEYRNFVIRLQQDAPQNQKRDFSLRGKGQSQQIISSGDLVQMLARFQHITELKYSVQGYDPSLRTVPQSISNQIKSTTQAIRFMAIQPDQTILNFILAAYNRSRRVLKQGKAKYVGTVTGLDSHTDEISLNFDDFSNALFETEDIQGTLNLDDLMGYPGPSILIGLCEQRIFNALC